MRFRLIAVVLLAGAAVFLSSRVAFASPSNQPTPSAGSIGIRLVPVPGATLNEPLANSYVVDRLAPGASLSRSVEIDNDTGAIADVSVYPAAANIVRGSFTFASGHGVNELSSWTSVSRNVLRLAPDTEAFDTLTISVPGTATSGEHYAVLWAEVSAAPGATGGVTLVNRVGVRVYLSIGPGGAPPSNFSVGSLTGERSTTGEPRVVTIVRNSGQNTLDIHGNLTLSRGPGGLGAGPFAATLGAALAPGASEPVNVQLNKGLPRGPWHADLTLTSGLISRSAIATITFPRTVGAAHAPMGAGFPSQLVVIIALLFLLGLTAFALLASRRKIWRLRPL